MQIVVTPSRKWIEDRFRSARSSIDIASPFVGSELQRLAKNGLTEAAVTVLTRTKLADFACGASSLETLVALAKAGATICSLNHLHAKVYVFDCKIALVTSANATYSGMNRNLECGIAIDSPDIPQSLALLVRSGFGAEQKPSRWTAADLDTLKKPVSVLRVAASRYKHSLETFEEPEQEAPVRLEKSVSEDLSDSFPGWTGVVFRAMLRLPDARFTTEMIFAECMSQILRRFPRNRFPREKMRQQLQVLRDLGLISFEAKGIYRRLVFTE